MAERAVLSVPTRALVVVHLVEVAVGGGTGIARRGAPGEPGRPARELVIPIGFSEGVALAHAWRRIPTPRPLTHELFAAVLGRLGAGVAAVRVIGRRAGTYLGELDVSTPRGTEVVACRPSDGITLALRQGVPAPIMVDTRLFDDGDVEPASPPRAS